MIRRASRWARPTSCASALTRRDDVGARSNRRRVCGELRAAYGPQPEDVILRLHRGLGRAAAAIEAGDLCLAGIETVLLRSAGPDVFGTRQARGNRRAGERRDSLAGRAARPGRTAGRAVNGRQGKAQAARPPSPPSPRRSSPLAKTTPAQNPRLPLDDGVYRPGVDDPHIILTGGAEEEGESRRSNGPPDDYTRLEDVFPGLRDAPALAIPLAPIDGFFGVSAGANEADLDGALGQYWALVHQIKQVDPTFADDELFPPGGIDGLTRQGRTNLINNLRMERAAAYYRMRGDVGFLQVETLRFLQGAVDVAYEEAVSEADASRLQPRLSREEAIGNWVDFTVRKDLKKLFDFLRYSLWSRRGRDDQQSRLRNLGEWPKLSGFRTQESETHLSIGRFLRRRLAHHKSADFSARTRYRARWSSFVRASLVALT